MAGIEYELLFEGFIDALKELGPMVDPEHFPHDKESILEMGRQGALAALAPVIWSAKVGDRRPVQLVADLLHISRQAVYKRIKEHTLLGVPGNGTTWIPMWQIDLDGPAVRPVTGEVIKAFRLADRNLSPLTIAAWACRDNDFLDGQSPADWIVAGKEDQKVVTAAMRAASRLAA